MSMGGRGIRFAKAFIELTVDAAKGTRALGRFRKQLNSIGRIATGVSAGLGVMTGALTRFTTQMVRAAATAQDVGNRFDVTFGKNRINMERFVSTLNQLGPGRQALKAIAADAGLVVKPLGATAAQTELFAQQMSQLSIDLASFRDRAPEDVFRRIASSLMGNTEAVRALGIVFTEAEVKARLLAKGMDPENATQMQKVMERFRIIMDRAAPAMGDLARTQFDFNNQVREFQGKYQDTMAELGRKILPDIAKGLREINAAMDKGEPLAEKMAGGIGAVAEASAAIFGPGGSNKSMIEALQREIQSRYMTGQGGSTLGAAYSKLVSLLSGAMGSVTGNVDTSGLEQMSIGELNTELRRRMRIERENYMDALDVRNRAGGATDPYDTWRIIKRRLMPGGLSFWQKAKLGGAIRSLKQQARMSMRSASEALAPRPTTEITQRTLAASGAMFSGVSKTMEIDIEKAQLTVLQDIREILRNGGVVFN